MAGAEVRRIADQLERAVRGPAWHGPSLLEVLDGVSATAASARPIPGAHSIHELVLHAAAWVDIVRLRVQGEAPDPVAPDTNWPPPGPPDARGWTNVVSRLKTAAADLTAVVRSLPDERLNDELEVEDDRWTVYATLHGTAQHLLYHAGQIALLKKGAGS
jgi:DinB superfamily